MKTKIKNYATAIDFLFTNLVALDVAIINKEKATEEVDFLTAEKLKLMPKFLEILDEYKKNVKENYNENNYNAQTIIDEITKEYKNE